MVGQLDEIQIVSYERVYAGTISGVEVRSNGRTMSVQEANSNGYPKDNPIFSI